MDNLLNVVFECLMILLVSIFASSEVSDCVDEYCFIYPEGDVTQSFDDARLWCSNNNASTLAVISNESSHEALMKFLSSSSISSTLYLNAKLNIINVATWYFVSGEHFNGTVENQGNQTEKDKMYQFYSSLEKGSQAFTVHASSHQEFKSYICKYKDLSGLNILPNTSYSHDGSTNVKYDNESVNWFEARNRCHLKGGDLATFSNLDYFNTGWLNMSYSYWIGIRWQNRRWNTIEDNQEIIYTRWSSGRPNNSSSECVCIDRSFLWNWTDCDCFTQRSFVCAKYRNISTTTSASTTSRSAASSQAGNNVSASVDKSNWAIGVGVGVGVGGGILLAVLVVVIVVIVMKKRKSKQGTTERTIMTKNEGKPNHEPTKPQDHEVVKQTVYADIMALAQPIVKEPTKDPIVYSNPEFVWTMTS